MEQHAREALDRALGWLCYPFGLTLDSGPANSGISVSPEQERLSVPRGRYTLLDSTNTVRHVQTQRTPAEAAVSSPESMDYEMHSALIESTTACKPDLSEPKPRCRDDKQAAEPKPNTGLAQYTDGPNRIVIINDGVKDCTALMLTEETMMLLSDVVRKRKGVKSMMHSFQEASHTASVGQDFLDYAPAMLEDATSREEYDGLKDDIEQRTPEIVRDIDHKAHLEEELHCKEQDLSESRDQFEEVFERILVESQLCLERCQETTTDGIETTLSMGTSEYGGMPAQQSPIAEHEPGEWDTMGPIQLTQQRLFEAQLEFDELRPVQEQQKAQYRQLRQEGLANFPESELDQLHLQEGRRITRALIEAEEEHDKACAEHGRGILHDDVDSQITMTDYTNGGSSPCHDPALLNVSFNPESVQAWAEMLSQGFHQEENNPELDEWESKTVTMSESISVVAEGDERRLLDQWRFVCDTVREGAYDSDAGAMAQAIAYGELRLVRQ